MGGHMTRGGGVGVGRIKDTAEEGASVSLSDI